MNNHFLKALFSEIFQARRSRSTVSVIWIDFSSSPISKDLMDTLFRSIDRYLEKNSYDKRFQVSSSEMALIISNQEQVLEEARKIYNVLQSLSQSDVVKSQLVFQVCLGEYPQSGRDALHLCQLIKQACASYREQFKNQSGLTVAKAPEKFKPDYQIPFKHLELS